MTSGEENVEIIKRQTEATRGFWVRGEPFADTLAPFFDPDVDYYPVRKFPGAGHRHGIAEVEVFLAGYRDAWEEVEWKLVDVTAVGDDRVLLRGSILGVGRESGAKLEGDVYICSWLRHGLIFRMEDHLTEAGARRALGLPPS